MLNGQTILLQTYQEPSIRSSNNSIQTRLRFFMPHLFSTHQTLTNARQTPELSVYNHSICFCKNYYHLIEKYWELHLELWLASWQIRAKLANITIKRNTVSVNVKNKVPIFNLCWLSKILTTSLPYLEKSLWLLDFATDVCICNDKNPFKNFVKNQTPLSFVTFKGVSPG